MTLLICGEALFDFFQDTAGQTGAIGFQARVGGSPFNVAVGMARLDGDAALLTGISTDMLGARLAACLAQEGVQTDFLIRSSRPTTLSLVGLDATGSPDYAFYGDGAADCSLTVAEMPPLPDSITGMHFGSYSIAVEPVASAFAALARAHAKRFISLDPNVRPTIEPDMARWRSRIADFAAVADLIKVSAEDLSMVYPSTPHADLAQTWLQGGTKLVIVTDGGASVRVFRAAGAFAIQPMPADVVDTVGAGDAFQACFLAQVQAFAGGPNAALAAPDDAIKAMVTRASHAATIVCQRRGADLPRTADLRAVP